VHEKVIAKANWFGFPSTPSRREDDACYGGFLKHWSLLFLRRVSAKSPFECSFFQRLKLKAKDLDWVGGLV